MMQIWPGAVVSLEKNEASKVSGKIKYSVVPGKAPTVGGWALAIPKKAKNPEASFFFINWLTSEKIALSRARETGFSTATQALYDDPVMLEKFSYLPAVKASLPYGQGWPQIGEFTSIWQIGSQELSRIFAAELSVQESAEIIQKRLDRLMDDGAYY
jgi:multiple sugar transport system substrate-binding protein